MGVGGESFTTLTRVLPLPHATGRWADPPRGQGISLHQRMGKAAECRVRPEVRGGGRRAEDGRRHAAKGPSGPVTLPCSIGGRAGSRRVRSCAGQTTPAAERSAPAATRAGRLGASGCSSRRIAKPAPAVGAGQEPGAAVFYMTTPFFGTAWGGGGAARPGGKRQRTGMISRFLFPTLRASGRRGGTSFWPAGPTHPARVVLVEDHTGVCGSVMKRSDLATVRTAIATVIGGENITAGPAPGCGATSGSRRGAVGRST